MGKEKVKEVSGGVWFLSVCGFGVVSFCRREVQFLLVMIWR
jgi:hypothetical protein